MITPVFAPPPFQNPPFDGKDLAFAHMWQMWIVALHERVNAIPVRVAGVTIDAGDAAVATTAVPGYDTQPGKYRVTASVRVRQAATTSSSVQITISWTENSITRTMSTLVLNANTTSQWDTVSALIRPDQGTPISYQVSYASVGATPMTFNADVDIERTAG